MSQTKSWNFINTGSTIQSVKGTHTCTEILHQLLMKLLILAVLYS